MVYIGRHFQSQGFVESANKMWKILFVCDWKTMTEENRFKTYVWLRL